jgi:hypothetical protein
MKRPIPNDREKKLHYQHHRRLKQFLTRFIKGIIEDILLNQLPMSSFEFGNEGRTQLSKEAARSEADLMRAQLKIDLISGRIPATLREEIVMLSHEGKEPTAADYDAALAAVEQLKELVMNQPLAEQALNVFGRLAANSAQGLHMVGFILRKAIHDDYDWNHTDMTSQKIGNLGRQFEDAAYQLNKLKIDARKYS